jgi:hypothetical protein
VAKERKPLCPISVQEYCPLNPLTIDPTDIPLPERPRDTLAARLAEVRALLERSDGSSASLSRWPASCGASISSCRTDEIACPHLPAVQACWAGLVTPPQGWTGPFL